MGDIAIHGLDVPGCSECGCLPGSACAGKNVISEVAGGPRFPLAELPEIMLCKASTIWWCAMPDRTPARRRSMPCLLRHTRRAAPVLLDADVDMTSTSTEYSAVVPASVARVLPNCPGCLIAAIQPAPLDLGEAEAHARLTGARRAPVGKNTELLRRLPSRIGWFGLRRALSTVHRRPELTGTLSASSVAHRTVNGFHAHGGTAITLNLVYVRLTPIVRDGVVDIVPAMRLNLCFGHRIPRGARSGRPVRGSGGRPGGGRVIRKIGTDVRVVGGELPRWVNFAACDPVRPVVEVSQPMLLRTLADAAVVHPHFMLVRSAGATDLLRSGGKVTGVSARTPDGEIEVPARLTVGADGRYSNVPGRPGFAVRKLPMDRDAQYSLVNAPAPERAAVKHGKSWSYQAIDRKPGPKRRIRRDLYYTRSPRAEPARLLVRST